MVILSAYIPLKSGNSTIIDQLGSNLAIGITVALAAFLFATITILPHWRVWIKRKKLSGLKKGSWGSASGTIYGRDNIGRIVYAPTTNDGKHTLIMGGTGTGKTSAILIPTLSHFDGNFLAIDISGDISAAVDCSGSLTFAPGEFFSSPYSIFGMIDALDNAHDQREQLEKLAFLLMPDTPEMSDASRYFNTEGRKILTAAFIAYYYAGLDFTEICRKVLSQSYTDLFRNIDAQGNEVASMLISSFRGTNEANTAGCKQAADAAIKLFALNDNIRSVTRRPIGNERAITPSVLEKRSVFLKIPEHLLDLYAPMLRIICSQTLTYFSTRPLGSSPSIMLALDEFPSLGMDATSIVSALQRFRKRNVSIMIVAQSMPSLDRIYGQITRKDMLNNFSYKVVLHAADADTHGEIARMIGHKSEKQTAKTSGRSTSITERDELVWAIDPEELGRLGNDLILIHPAGYERLRKAPYYKYSKKQSTQTPITLDTQCWKEEY